MVGMAGRLDRNTQQGRGNAEHAAITITTAVGHQDVAVRIESEDVAEGLNSDDCSGDRIIFRNRILGKDLKNAAWQADTGYTRRRNAM